jgi:hypothetical protein
MLSGRFQGFIPPKWAHFHEHILRKQPADRSRVLASATSKTAPIEIFPVLEAFRSRNLSGVLDTEESPFQPIQPDIVAKKNPFSSYFWPMCLNR